ncbi:hypothetical protein AMJ86_04755 [bacterium SM23_57]|nr:MAG: hypothetical protein AMJ86_04755 [bacterium SM23_57]
MSQWIEIRDAPKPNGKVIAVWHNTKPKTYELAFGVTDLEYPEDLENEYRTYASDSASIITRSLVHEISEAEFSVHVEIMEIPQIISDGMLHYLGELQWCYRHHSIVDTVIIPCSGKVYTKVILSPHKWYDPEKF